MSVVMVEIPEGLPDTFPQKEIANYLDCKQVYHQGCIYTIPRMTATHETEAGTQIAFVIATDGKTYAIETKGVSRQAFEVVNHNEGDLISV